MSLASTINLNDSGFLRPSHSLNLLVSSSASIGLKTTTSDNISTSLPNGSQFNMAEIKDPAEKNTPNNISKENYIETFANQPHLAALSPTRLSTQVLLNEFPGSTRIQEQQQQMYSNDDSRAYKLALELSMVGLDDRPNGLRPLPMGAHVMQMQQHNQQQTEYMFDSLRAAVAAVAQTTNTCTMKDGMGQNGFSPSELPQLPSLEDRTKKSQNMTECVPVPSSEHVAEIVGRQGCKIKALRTKTNTYIKTPVRGEEPVFVVTGRKEDVAKAKREIISAAEHFSFIRASRRTLSDGTHVMGSDLNGIAGGNVNRTCSKGPSSGGPTLPGQITIKVRVPYRVVGLVVGPKGATIKHIQQETQTYIITPSRDKEPVFEVTGLPDNVQSARQQIESHIALRTGNLQTESPIAPATDVVTINQIFNEEINPDFLASLYKNGMFDYVVDTDNSRGIMSPIAASVNGMCVNAMNRGGDFQQNYNQIISAMENPDYIKKIRGVNQIGNVSEHEIIHQLPHKLNFPHCTVEKINDTNLSATQKATESQANLQGTIRSCSSASSTTSSKSTNCSNGSRPELVNIWKGAESSDVDEGIGESPNIWTLPASLTALTGPNSSPSTSISPTDSLLGEISTSTYTFHQIATSQNDANIQKIMEFCRRECLICNNKTVTAALVPCGHNLFCMECANSICCSADATCPVCNLPVYQAMRIFS